MDGSVALSRPARRLRSELVDDGIAVDADERVLGIVLDELEYARRPPQFERRTPIYGAIVVPDDRSLVRAGELVDVIDLADVPLETARRFADGRSAYLARRPPMDDAAQRPHSTRATATAAAGGRQTRSRRPAGAGGALAQSRAGRGHPRGPGAARRRRARSPALGGGAPAVGEGPPPLPRPVLGPDADRPGHGGGPVRRRPAPGRGPAHVARGGRGRRSRSWHASPQRGPLHLRPARGHRHRGERGGTGHRVPPWPRAVRVRRRPGAGR